MNKNFKNIFFLLLLFCNLFFINKLQAQCDCAASAYGSIDVAGWTVSQSANITTCQYGEERATISNTVAGAVYLVSSCGASYDTQLSIYTTGCSFVTGGYNDDNGPACGGTAASVQFTSPGGNLYSVFNKYNCTSQATCATVSIQLISLPCTPSTNPTGASASVNPTCPSGATTLSVSGGSLGTGASWKWYTVSCGGTLAGTGATLGVSPASTTQYWVRAEGTCGTTTCATVTVTVNSNSIAPGSASASVNPTCPSGATTLSRSGGSLGTGGAWKWYTGSCGGTLAGTGATLGVSPAVSTQYWVRAEGTCNTTACATVTVSVQPNTAAPTSVSVSPASPICNGTPTTLSLNGALMAYYPFSANVNDASGNGLNLSGAGGSFSGGGIQLTNASAYSSAVTNILNADKYTISFYMQYTSASDGSWRKIFGFEPAGTDRSPGIWRYPTSMQLHWRHDPGNTGLTEAKTYTQGQWYYVVGEKNGATFTVFVDGVQVDQGAVANPKTTGSAVLWFGGANVLLKEFKIYSGAIKWYTGSCGGTLVGSGPSISVSPAASTTYYSRLEGICNTTACVNATINVDNPLPQAFAGEDMYLCSSTPNNTVITMTATGSGTWTQLSGPNTPNIVNSALPTTQIGTITGLISGTYVFRWAASNACGPTYDDVVIYKP